MDEEYEEGRFLPTSTFYASYEWRGHTWSIEIAAYDWDDAVGRCDKLGLKLAGKAVGAPIPIQLASNFWLARIFVEISHFICWLFPRNNRLR